MAVPNVVVIGASAGGVQALQRLCAGFPPDMPAAVLIVQHISRRAPGLLAQVLGRVSALPVDNAAQGQLLQQGRIFVAMPDRHLLIDHDRMVLSRGPEENSTRPSIDALFRSAAVHCGSRVVAVVLTGTLDDGTEGLLAIHRAGGICVVQDPADAEWPSMPASAIRHDHVDHVAALRDLPLLIAGLVRRGAGPSASLPADVLAEERISRAVPSAAPIVGPTPGRPSDMSCPDCGGVLNEIGSGEELRFRCQIGHAFTQLGLRDAQLIAIERGLTVAMRTHRERVSLFGRMAAQAANKGHTNTARRWQEAAVDARQLSEMLERAISALAEHPEQSRPDR